MALRATLDELVEMARDEARLSTASSRSVDHTNHVRSLVRTHYRQLVEEYDWKHLILKREDCTKTMEAGSRYYDFPEELNELKIGRVWFKWGNQWCELPEGIDYHHYNIKDSENDERSDPVERWNWHGDRQFEVWPVPASNGGIVGFDGQKKAQALVDGADRADLDDLMIALYVAGELLMENGQEKAAQAKLARANARRGRLVVGLSKRVEGATFGGHDPKMQPVHHGISISHIRKGP